MLELLKNHQLNIMLVLCGMCIIIAFFTLVTKPLTKIRRASLLIMEVSACVMLAADRYAYIYRGDTSVCGYWMVRICNFLVFYLTIATLHGFNMYLLDLYRNEGKLEHTPRRLRIAEVIIAIGELLVIVSQFTGLYYTFDEQNRYTRAPGFIISYILPLLILIMQLSVIITYYNRIRRGIRIAILIFSVIPLTAAILQIFAYGLSLINMSIVGTVVLLYIFVLLDMNDRVAQANRMEIEFLKKEQLKSRKMLLETAKAFVNAIEAKDSYTQGHSSRVAKYSRMIAQRSGKGADECDIIYFAALLHDVGKIGVDEYIINKDGKLTDEEYAEIKRHPTYGEQILAVIDEYPFLSQGAHYHHERYDGKGYPCGLKGEEIPEIARIVAVADAYDAMTSKRSYRDPFSQERVREEIEKGMGTQFDPAFAKVMLELIDEDKKYQMREM